MDTSPMEEIWQEQPGEALRDRIDHVGVELREADAEARRTAYSGLDRLDDQDHLTQAQYNEARDTALNGIRALKLIDRELHKPDYAYALTIDEMETRLKESDAYHRRGKRYRKGKLHLLSPTPTNAQIDMLEKRGSHFAQGMKPWKLLLLFFVGSLFGVILEMLWCFVVHGHFESRAGLVYGPFNLLYGFGAVIISLALYRLRNLSKLFSFVGGFVAGTAVEFSCSYLQEKLFGSTSWDYSHLPFNIQGRVCLLYSLFWGVLGVVWIKDIYPHLSALILKIPNRVGKPLTVILTVFLLMDGMITSAAVLRWKARTEDIPAQSALDTFLDEHYTDERLEGIFSGWNFVSQERETDTDDVWYRIFTEDAEK